MDRMKNECESITCHVCGDVIPDDALAVFATKRTLVGRRAYRIDEIWFCARGCAQGFFDCDEHSDAMLGWGPEMDRICARLPEVG